VVSFVGCFSGIFSNGEDESDITCEELVWDGSFARDFWNWMERAAIISSSCFLSRSSIDSNVLNMRSSRCSIMSKLGSDTKMLRTSVTGDERCIIWMGKCVG
jgi:hypothetical protein